MKLSSCPNFINAPFIWPSSRATSSLLRMANRSSSVLRRASSRTSDLRARWTT